MGVINLIDFDKNEYIYVITRKYTKDGIENVCTVREDYESAMEIYNFLKKTYGNHPSTICVYKYKKFSKFCEK